MILNQENNFQVYLQKKGGRSVDITETLSGLTWSGDYQQVARKLDIEILYAINDNNQPVVIPDAGDRVTMNYNGSTVFAGIVWTRDLSSKAQFIKVTCYDPLIYLQKSNVCYNFREMTAEGIASQVASGLGISVGSLASTGVTMNLVAIDKTAYDTIMTAYTKASKSTGIKYLPRYENNALSIIEKGTTEVSLKMDYDYNVEGTQFTESLDGMVSRVIIHDEDGNIINTVDNGSWIDAYGIIQATVQSEKDKDMNAEAKNTLKPVERKANVEALGCIEAITGNSIVVRDEHTGLSGLFYIDGDSHTFINNVYEMQLTIAFENIMDEKTEDAVNNNTDSGSDSSDASDGSDSGSGGTSSDNSWLDNWKVDSDGNVVEDSDGDTTTSSNSDSTTSAGAATTSSGDSSWLDNWEVDSNGNVIEPES